MERKSLIRAGLIAGAVLVIGLLLWGLWPAAAVEGSTPPERVASVKRMTDERPHGAAQTLGNTAVSSQEHPTVRQAALVGLARFPANNARPLVEKSLGDVLPEIRAAAAAAMGAYDDIAACDALGAIILDSPDPDPEVRIGAIQGLGLNPCSKALAWLVRVVERETNPAVHRRALIEAYAKLSMHYYFPDSASETKAQRLCAAEFFKGQFAVQDAYRQANWPLDRQPEYQYVTSHKAKERVDNK